VVKGKLPDYCGHRQNSQRLQHLPTRFHRVQKKGNGTAVTRQIVWARINSQLVEMVKLTVILA
jgi:hypothetical protein